MKRPLSTNQKRTLAIIAREAFDLLYRHGALDVPAGKAISAAFNDWRHEQQAAVLTMGRDSLTEATQADYNPLKAHFLSFKGGSSGDAFTAAMASLPADEARRQALWHLDRELKRQSLHISYARAIAADRFKRQLDELLPGQLIQILATVRNRGKGRPGSAGILPAQAATSNPY